MIEWPTKPVSGQDLLFGLKRSLSCPGSRHRRWHVGKEIYGRRRDFVLGRESGWFAGLSHAFATPFDEFWPLETKRGRGKSGYIDLCILGLAVLAPSMTHPFWKRGAYLSNVLGQNVESATAIATRRKRQFRSYRQEFLADDATLGPLNVDHSGHMASTYNVPDTRPARGWMDGYLGTQPRVGKRFWGPHLWLVNLWRRRAWRMAMLSRVWFGVRGRLDLH